MTAAGSIGNALEGVSRLILASRNRIEAPPPHSMSHVAKRVLILQLEIEDILETLHRGMAADDSADCGTTNSVTPSKPFKQNYGEARRRRGSGWRKPCMSQMMNRRFDPRDDPSPGSNWLDILSRLGWYRHLRKKKRSWFTRGCLTQRVHIGKKGLRKPG